MPAINIPKPVKLTTWLLPMFFALLIFVQEYIGPRSGDRVEYGFVVPVHGQENPYRRIRSIGDVIESQHNHYLYENGRVAVHSIVQSFCALDPSVPWLFGLFDAAVFMLFVLLMKRLLRWGSGARQMLLLSALLYLYIVEVQTDIAYQVNYLWIATLVTGFVVAFTSVRVKKCWQWILLILLGFVTGESNEAFTAGLGLALAAYMMLHRHQLKKEQLCVALTFAAGFFFNVLAPGNQVRLDSYTPQTVVARLANLVLWNWYFVPLVILLIWRHRRGLNLRLYVRRYAYALVAVAGLAFVLLMVGSVYLNACMGIRLALMIMLLGALRDVRLSRGWAAALLILVTVVAYMKISDTLHLYKKYNYIMESYLKSRDGNVFLSGEMMGSEYRKTNDFIIPLTWVRRSTDPQAPVIKVWPQGTENLTADKDTNMVVDMGGDSWAAVQSKRNPRPIYLVKYLPFGNKAVWVRELDFDSSSWDYWDESEGWRMAVYHNNMPWLFRCEMTLEP